MKYPTWKIQGFPTPSECLMVCEECQEASWTQHWPGVAYCYNYYNHKNNKNCRMRKGTANEKQYEQL